MKFTSFSVKKKKKKKKKIFHSRTNQVLFLNKFELSFIYLLIYIVKFFFYEFK